ncbi:carbonate dehydratase [Anopheles sinensis]|uniref:Carbonate dehydratase n=1 Tax=Anopheles sinensis TaxID=74873 RepID=A0A084VSC4_ANOSI|nr:carbonate dehydratase [Anopheles sinensis]
MNQVYLEQYSTLFLSRDFPTDSVFLSQFYVSVSKPPAGQMIGQLPMRHDIAFANGPSALQRRNQRSKLEIRSCCSCIKAVYCTPFDRSRSPIVQRKTKTKNRKSQAVRTAPSPTKQLDVFSLRFPRPADGSILDQHQLPPGRRQITIIIPSKHSKAKTLAVKQRLLERRKEETLARGTREWQTGGSSDPPMQTGVLGGRKPLTVRLVFPGVSFRSVSGFAAEIWSAAKRHSRFLVLRGRSQPSAAFSRKKDHSRGQPGSGLRWLS